MTIKEAKNLLVKTALAEVGYSEGANNYNKYANGVAKYFGWDVQNQPWCDVFVDWCFINSFGGQTAAILTYQPVGGFSALCSASANYYKANGAWFTTPQIGDQAFFNVSGGINHTGIVVGVSGGVVTTVEGNSSDAVRRNSYGVSSSYIAGFGRPKWSVFSEGNAETQPSTPSDEDLEKPKIETCSVSVKLPVIQYGDASMWVTLMQTALIGRGFNCGWYGADGEYGQQTKIALYEFQKKRGLTTDCVCGQSTWKKLLEA